MPNIRTRISKTANAILIEKGFCTESNLSYRELTEKMLEKGFNLLDLTSLLGLTLTKDKEAIVLTETLEKLSKEQRDAINRLITSCIDSSWFSKISTCLNPTDRVHEIVEKYIPRFERRNIVGLPESFYKAWADQHRGTKVYTEDIPKIAEYFNLSPHFLFAFPYSVPYYSKVPDIEEIVTKFFFLPERMKKEILLTVQEV